MYNSRSITNNGKLRIHFNIIQEDMPSNVLPKTKNMFTHRVVIDLNDEWFTNWST